MSEDAIRMAVKYMAKINARFEATILRLLAAYAERSV